MSWVSVWLFNENVHHYMLSPNNRPDMKIFVYLHNASAASQWDEVRSRGNLFSYSTVTDEQN